MVKDLATQWIQAYPCKNKNFTRNPEKLAKSSWNPKGNQKVIYTDNSLEFGKACEDLSWNHCTSTPHRSETNGFAERAVRRVKEGTSAVLLQSGLNESWWADSMECYTYLRNVTDLLSDGKTPYERRFGWPFGGPVVSIWFIGWVLPYNCEGSVSNPSIWKESFTWIVPSDTLSARVEFGRVTYWSQTLRIWRRWTHRKSTQNLIPAKIEYPDESILACTDRSFSSARLASHQAIAMKQLLCVCW